MSDLHQFSGFELIDESGNVLAKSESGSDLIKSHVSGYTRKDGSVVKAHDRRIEAHGVKGMKSTPWRKTFKSQKHFEDWLEKDDGNSQVLGTRELEHDEADSTGKTLVKSLVVFAKSHVRGYTRKDGTFVAEHDDNRVAAHKVGDMVRIHDNLQHADRGHVGKVTRVYENGGIGGDLPAYAVEGADGPFGHGEVDAHHPNVIGMIQNHREVRGAHVGDGSGDPTSPQTVSFDHDGRTYKPTGKKGNSLHDGTEVHEFSADLEDESAHRVWADKKGRVHADSN